MWWILVGLFAARAAAKAAHDAVEDALEDLETSAKSRPATRTP